MGAGLRFENLSEQHYLCCTSDNGINIWGCDSRPTVLLCGVSGVLGIV